MSDGRVPAKPREEKLLSSSAMSDGRAPDEPGGRGYSQAQRCPMKRGNILLEKVSFAFDDLGQKRSVGWRGLGYILEARFLSQL